MKTLRQFLREYLDRQAIRGGYSWNTESIAKVMEIMTFALMLASMLVFFVTHNLMVSLPLLLLPALPTAVTMVWAKYSVDQVKTNVEWELPFFMVILDIVNEVGGDITHAFEMSGKVGLRWISREWSIIKSLSMVAGTLDKAMVLRAREHPSGDFQTLLNRYIAIRRYSGDVSGFIRDFEDYELKGLINRLSSLIKDIVNITTVVIASIILITLFAIISMILGIENSMLYLVLPITLLMPAIVMRVYISIPKILRIESHTEPRVYMLMVALSTASIVTALVMRPYGLVALSIPPIAFSIITSKETEKIRSSVLALPNLVRDLTEVVRAGINIGAAIERVLDNDYPEPLKKYLRSVVTVGGELRNAPWLMTYTINLLNELMKFGSPVKALETLSNAMLSIKGVMVDTSYSAKSLVILDYVVPPAFATVVFIGKYIISMLNSLISNAPYTLVGLGVPSINVLVMPIVLVSLIISISAALLTSLFSKWSLKPALAQALPIALTVLSVFFVTVLF